MSIKVLFFASLREAVGVASLSLELPPQAKTVAELRDLLAAKGEAWLALTKHKNLRAAVNQSVVDFTASVKDGDEVAFFPPVTGG